MKSVIKSIRFMGAAVIFLALAACGKSDNNSNNVAAVQYHMNGTSCYDANNSPVAYNLCTGIGANGGYQYNGTGQCIMTANNQIVDPTYCAQLGNSGFGYNTGYPYGQTYGGNYGYGYGYGYGYNGAYAGAQNCNGKMMYTTNGYAYGAQLILCGPGFCTGQFLIDIHTKQRVLCQ